MSAHPSRTPHGYPPCRYVMKENEQHTPGSAPATWRNGPAEGELCKMKTINQVGRWIAARSQTSVVIAATAVIVLMGVVDHALGPEVAFSAVYLLPLVAVGWRLTGRHYIVLAVCALASGASLIAEATHIGLAPAVGAWNATSRLAIFFLIVRLLQELRSSLTVQSELATRDPLTGVYNQRAFGEHMLTALGVVKRNHEPISLVYLDLDDFKSINDTIGHSGGNDVLCSFASALNDSTRETDIVGRLGGDEFAVILPGAGSTAVQGIMSDLLARLQESLPVIDLKRSITFSAGVVTFLRSPESLDEMINAADRLMYEVKKGGKASYKHATFGDDARGAAPDVHIPRDGAADSTLVRMHSGSIGSL